VHERGGGGYVCEVLLGPALGLTCALDGEAQIDGDFRN
jgi:hypothetical protein